MSARYQKPEPWSPALTTLEKKRVAAEALPLAVAQEALELRLASQPATTIKAEALLRRG